MSDTTHAEMAARLLEDAAAFLGKIGRDNPSLLQQTMSAGIGYSAVAGLLRLDSVDGPGKLGHAGRAVQQLRAAAGLFTTLSQQLLPMQDQMAENARVFLEVARLLETDPLGRLPEERATRLSPAAANTIKDQQQAVAGTPRARPATPAPAPLRDPLSPALDRLNGHSNYLDPRFGLSFPTPGRGNPVSVLWPAAPHAPLVQAVSRRDNHICRYCGLRSAKYQQAVGPFGAVSNAQAHCACPMCAQVMALDRVGAMRSGVLIHLPEIGQAQLHGLMRVVYVCRITRGATADLARAALAGLLARRTGAQERFGSDEPTVLCAALAEAPDPAAHDAVLARVAGIRLLPLDRRIIREGDLEFNQFPQILAYWRSKRGPFGGLTPSSMDLGAVWRILEAAIGPLGVPAA